MRMTWTGRLRLLVVVPALLLLGGGVNAQGQGRADESAWDGYLASHPQEATEGAVGPLERRILEELTPKQAEAYADGADPASIVLESGETLADLMATLLAGGQGLVYVPLDKCPVFRTVATPAGLMAPGETRQFFVRGTDLSTQGGSATGCMVPPEAVAAVMHFRVTVLPPSMAGVPGRLEVERLAFAGAATIAVEYLRVGSRIDFTGSSVLALCEGAPCGAGDIEVTTVGAGGQVRGDVIGYFRPIAVADLPGGMGGGLDADTLDGKDSTDLSLISHTHDGGDIVSGTVGDPFFDPQITRDIEVFPILQALDGPGSTLDADLLDGKELSAFRPRLANVITVHPTDGDYPTIQAALDDIGVGLPAASAVNRYLIQVANGTYNEQVTMKAFVDIEGKGKDLTVISAPSIAGPQGTVECADEAELRHLTVESTGGGEKAIAIRCLGTAPMLTHVKASATGATGGATPENIAVLNDGAGATPMLNGVDADASPSPGLAVVNQNGASPEIRDSNLAGADSGSENRDTATAKIANTEIAGGADVMAPALQSSYMCVRAYVSGTLQKLNAECNPNTPPMATDDSYKTLGNTLLEVDLAVASGAPAVTGEDPGPPALYADVLDNDTDAETPAGLTASLNAGSVTAGAVVNMNADGSFSYLPPVDMTGPDTFEYTVTDPGGLTDVGTVTIDISTTMIWYVDKDNAGTADGRSSQPYTTLAPIDAGGADDGKDDTGDTIFVFSGTGTTSGGILLEDNQVLQGNGAALDPAGFNYAGGAELVSASTRPTLTDGTGDVIDLASGNTVRGLNVSSTAGLAIDGSSIAGATIDGVNLGSAGAGAGVLFSGATGTIAVSNLDVLANTGSGIDIQGGSATFTFDSSTSVTSPNSAAFNVSGGTAQVTYSGGITQANNFPAVSVTNHANGAGTGITFQTGTLSATMGTGLQFSNADGTYNFNGTTTLMGGDAGIDILAGSSGNFTFGAGTAITNPSGIGFNVGASTGGAINYNGTIGQTNAQPAVRIDGKTGGSATFSGAITASTSTSGAINLTNNAGGTFTFSGPLNLTTTSGTAFNAGGGTVQVTNAGNTVNTAGDGASLGIGIDIDAAIGALGVNFNTVNVGSSGKARSGIRLANTGSAGSFNVTGGTIQNTTVRGFRASNVDGAVSVGASLQNDTNRSVEINSGSAGTFEFTGAINEDDDGILIAGSSGSYTFKGGLDIDTTGTNTGFDASGGGTLTVCDDTNCDGTGTAVSNTIDTTNPDVGEGIGLVINGVTLGTAGVTFQSINVGTGGGGPTRGIDINSAGTTGFFEVTGTGANPSGGTIRNTSENGILVRNTDNITIQNMDLTTAADDGGGVGACDSMNFGSCRAAIEFATVKTVDLLNVDVSGSDEHGIFGQTVTDLDLTNVTVTNAGQATSDEHGIYIRELLGTANNGQESIFDNVDVTASGSNGIFIENTTGTTSSEAQPDLLIVRNGSSLVNHATNTGLIVEADAAAANLMLDVQTGTQFNNNTSRGVSANANAGRLQLTVNGSTFGPLGHFQAIAGGSTAAGANSELILNLTGNNITQAGAAGTGPGAIVFSSFSTGVNDGTMRGTISGNIINSAANSLDAIALTHEGDSTGNRFVLDNNNITLTDAGMGAMTGMNLQARASSGRMNLRITNNTVSIPSNTSTFSGGIAAIAGNGTPGESNTLCIFHNANNVSTPAMNAAAGGFDLEYQVVGFSGNTVEVEGLSMPFTDANLETHIEAVNATGGTDAGVTAVVALLGGTLTSGTCTAP